LSKIVDIKQSGVVVADYTLLQVHTVMGVRRGWQKGWALPPGFWKMIFSYLHLIEGVFLLVSGLVKWNYHYWHPWKKSKSFLRLCTQSGTKHL